MAQTIEIRAGAVLTMSGGATWDLEGSMLDFGSAGETTRLDEQDAARVTGGLLTATRALNSPSGANPAGLGAVISAGTDLGATTIVRGHAVQTGGGNPSIARYYDIAPAQHSGLDATLVFTYNDAELGGLPEGSLALFRSADGGVTWVARGYDSRDAALNQVTLSGISAFSRWTLGSEADPLPVELVDLRAARSGGGAEISWRTASETNNAGFWVQRRVLRPEENLDGALLSNSADWTALGFVEAAAGGTTTEPHRYRFVDGMLPFEASRLGYRLEQVDLDGTAHVSPAVELTLGAADQLVLHGPFPNPGVGRVTLRYELPRAGAVRLDLYNALGQHVATIASGPQAAGRTELPLETTRLASGVYLLRLSADGQTRTQRLTVIR